MNKLTFMQNELQAIRELLQFSQNMGAKQPTATLSYGKAWGKGQHAQKLVLGQDEIEAISQGQAVIQNGRVIPISEAAG